MKTIMFALIVLASWPLPPAFSNSKIQKKEIPERLAIKCLIGESAGESFRGMVAVGEVLRRRGSVKGFVGCRAVGDPPGSRRLIERARRAWRKSRFTNYSRDADHFDSVFFKRPWWSKKMRLTCKLGNHLFWKE